MLITSHRQSVICHGRKYSLITGMDQIGIGGNVLLHLLHFMFLFNIVFLLCSSLPDSANLLWTPVKEADW